MYRVETLDGCVLEESVSYNCVMWWLWNQSHTWRIVSCKTEWTMDNVPSVKMMIYKVDRVR